VAILNQFLSSTLASDVVVVVGVVDVSGVVGVVDVSGVDVVAGVVEDVEIGEVVEVEVAEVEVVGSVSSRSNKTIISNFLVCGNISTATELVG
jgi:hypothetical protein